MSRSQVSPAVFLSGRAGVTLRGDLSQWHVWQKSMIYQGMDGMRLFPTNVLLNPKPKTSNQIIYEWIFQGPVMILEFTFDAKRAT